MEQILNPVKSLLKQSTEELLRLLCVNEFELEILEEDEGFLLTIKTNPSESKFLIGQYGINLSSFQHLLRVIVRKKSPEKITFSVDIDGYKKNRLEYLKNLALGAVERAKRENTYVVLEPMSPSDRRIIHIELSKNKDITTESIGEGENRRVSIKPNNQ